MIQDFSPSKVVTTHPRGATFAFSLPLGTPPAIDLHDAGQAPMPIALVLEDEREIRQVRAQLA